MIGNSGELRSTKATSNLFFSCKHCGIALVIDCTAAGVTPTCHGCGKPLTVPQEPGSSSGMDQVNVAEKIAELHRHLKENESQRTEVKGYINQLSIQLHRWQLRLQALDERNIQLNGQITALVEV